MQQSGRKRRQRSNGAGPEARARLVALIEEATVDAYDESEQAVGLYTMICENLTLPFKTRVACGVAAAPAPTDPVAPSRDRS